jgi:O-antigen/teichoic acid export membrane protein
VTNSRVLANTGYRLLADVGGKVGSVVLFIVMGRKLGDASFGVFTFAYSLVAIVTALADFGQDKVLTREVARERGLLDRYFLNTLVLKLGLALPALAVAVAALALGGRSEETVATVALLGAAVLVDLLASTAYATFQAYERLEFIPVALITERFVTAGAGIVALLLGAGVVTVAAIFLGGALLTFVLAMRLLFRHVVRPAFRIERSRWWPLMLAATPIGLAGIASVFLFRIDTVLLAAFKSD